MAVSIDEFSKALRSLENALALPKNDIVRDASIQRFEFCVELAWETAKKHMGTSTSAPKQVIREMAQAGLVSDVTFWFEVLKGRNESSHSYNEPVAEKIYALAKTFLPEARELQKKLK
jgi:nucleotidyltransferase substrate binding protein (TIGR01987 family)